MAHFAFFMLPEPGHMLPTLRVASLLRERGHAVTYFCPPYLEDFFQRHGFASHRILSWLIETDQVDLWRAPEGRAVFQALYSYRKKTKVNLVEILARELRALNFDVLLCDSLITSECGAPLREALERPILSLNPILPGDGIAPAGIQEIVLCPPDFCLPLERDANLINNPARLYVEPSIFRERQGQKVPKDVTSYGPFVYCSFGTQTARYPGGAQVMLNVIEAFRKIPAHLIVSSSYTGELQHPASLPENVTITSSDSRQLDLLSYSALCINHGGLGTLKECVMCSVPVLVIPFDLDQPANGARVEHHRLGRTCAIDQASPATIQTLVEELMNDEQTLFSTWRMSKTFWRYEVKAPSIDFLAAQVS